MEPKSDVRFRGAEVRGNSPRPGKLLTQHTGLPPRPGVKPRPAAGGKPKPKR